jgi:hypothetical protein
MKKLLAITVLTLLGAGFAAAQTPQDMGNTATPGATFVTGVVIAVTSDAISLRKDSGETVTVFHDAATVGNHSPAMGSRVQVNYKLEEGRAIATEIRGPGETMASTRPVSTSAPAPALAPVTTAPAATPDPARRTSAYGTTAAPAPSPNVMPAALPAEDLDDDDTTEPAYLPATASKGPAFALLGLLALVAAAALRVSR